MVHTIKIFDKKVIRLLFILCWIVYFCTYIGRLNYSAAMADMISNNVISLTQAGTIGTLYFICYAIGQFINGFIADKISSKIMIAIGLIISATCNFLFPISPNFFIMTCFWTMNGFALSMIWPPIAHILSDMLDRDTMVKCSVNLTTTIAIGTLSSYLLSATMLSVFGYKWAFFSAAIALYLVCAIWLIGFTRVQRLTKIYGVVLEQNPDDKMTSFKNERLPISKLVFSPIVFVIFFPLIAHGMLKDGMVSWVPTYITEIFLTNPVNAVLASTVLPIINVGGVYIANFINKKLIKNEIATSGVFFSISFIALTALYFFGNINMIITVTLLAIVTACMTAINTMLISIIPLYFGKFGRASTMSGILNSIAYLGSSISMVLISFLVDKFGWGVTILSWWLICGLSLIICFWGRNQYNPIPRNSE